MTPLPPPLGGGEFVAWRLVNAQFAETWDSGEGSFIYGGRWSSRERRVLYCSLDPSTTILEMAVHFGLDLLATIPHVLISLRVRQPADVLVIGPDDIPDPDWMTPEKPKHAQQAFGDALLAEHPLVAIPSVVSRNSWNLLISIPPGPEAYELRSLEPFVLDSRLSPASHP